MSGEPAPMTAARDEADSWVDRMLDVEVGPVAHGGHCVARHEGRVVFVRHTLPGERVRAVVTEDGGGSFCRADAVAVLREAPGRVEPVCPWAGPGGCGGCDFQHAAHDTQRGLKAAVVAEQLARLPFPTVAAVHGACMGGGTELILACRQRIAADDDSTRIALPEVMLGIHPGWGGTARLPRLIGATDALPVMLTGRTLSARRALALGVIDRVAPPAELLAEARALLRRPHARPLSQRAKAWATNLWPV